MLVKKFTHWTKLKKWGSVLCQWMILVGCAYEQKQIKVVYMLTKNKWELCKNRGVVSFSRDKVWTYSFYIISNLWPVNARIVIYWVTLYCDVVQSGNFPVVSFMLWQLNEFSAAIFEVFFIVHTGVQISSLIFLQNMGGEVMHMGIEILDCTKGTKLFSHFHLFRDFN